MLQRNRLLVDPPIGPSGHDWRGWLGYVRTMGQIDALKPWMGQHPRVVDAAVAATMLILSIVVTHVSVAANITRGPMPDCWSGS
jgi:hypothetical protein